MDLCTPVLIFPKAMLCVFAPMYKFNSITVTVRTKHRKCSPAMVALVLLTCPVQLTLPPPVNAQLAPADKSKTGLATDEEFVRKKLTAPQELPFLAEFPKKTFLSGTVTPKSNHGPSYVLYYAVSTAPNEVLDWYEKSLVAEKWKIHTRMKHMLNAAHPQGHACIVMTQLRPPKYDETTKKFISDTKLSIYFQTKWQ